LGSYEGEVENVRLVVSLECGAVGAAENWVFKETAESKPRCDFRQADFTVLIVLHILLLGLPNFLCPVFYQQAISAHAEEFSRVAISALHRIPNRAPRTLSTKRPGRVW